jgi:uncharacterized membrane protein
MLRAIQFINYLSDWVILVVIVIVSRNEWALSKSKWEIMWSLALCLINLIVFCVTLVLMLINKLIMKMYSNLIRIKLNDKLNKIK